MVDPTAPESAPDTPAPAEEAPVVGTEEKLAAAEAEVSRLNDEFLRAMAEAENTRRRAAEDVTRAHKFGIESFATALLAVRDSLEAALAVQAPTIESLHQGVEITHRQLTSAFEKFAITEISPLGEKFDPYCHEAMGQVEADQEPNTVATVMRKGYRLHERVIRPALVMVAAEKAAPPPPEAEKSP